MDLGLYRTKLKRDNEYDFISSDCFFFLFIDLPNGFIIKNRNRLNTVIILLLFVLNINYVCCINKTYP